MSKELDTSWFDLKNYEAFKKMPISGWIWQLLLRHYYHQEVNYGATHPDQTIRDFLFPLAKNLKGGVIPNSPTHPPESLAFKTNLVLEGHSFTTTSVDSLASYDLWTISNDKKLSHVWEACQHVSDYLFEDDPNEALSEIAYTPLDLHIKQSKNTNFSTSAHVVVDLSATDEQIKIDFAHWLTHYRQAIKYQHKKRLFSQADFDYWIEYGVIPYMDLVLIAKIEGKKITQNKLARLIFPNEYNVDIVERIRKVTKPTAEWLINNQIHSALSTQYSYENVTGMKNVRNHSGIK